MCVSVHVCVQVQNITAVAHGIQNRDLGLLGLELHVILSPYTLVQELNLAPLQEWGTLLMLSHFFSLPVSAFTSCWDLFAVYYVTNFVESSWRMLIRKKNAYCAVVARMFTVSVSPVYSREQFNSPIYVWISFLYELLEVRCQGPLLLLVWACLSL